MKITRIEIDTPATIIFDDGTALEVETCAYHGGCSNSFPLRFFKEGMEFRDLQEFWEDVEALSEF